MTEVLDRIVTTREQAHEVARMAYAHSQALILDGKRVRITAGEGEEDITVKQRGFLHAAVFPQIAEQVRVDGVRFVAAVWKEHLRQLFLPDKWELRFALVRDKQGRLRRGKRKTPHRIRQSTEDLGIKGYSQHIDRCIDHAVLEWGVVFVFDEAEREAVRWKPKERKAKQQQPEAATA